MARAIALSIENVHAGRGGPFAAVIVKDGKILAEGANSVTSTNDPTAHAEVTAIRNACRALASFDLSSCEIYTSCEPCPMCLGAIFWARPARVFFSATHVDAAAAGFDDSFIYEQIEVPHGERSIPMIHVDEQLSTRPFEEWKSKADKTEY